MRQSAGGSRFLSSTRGRMVALLRRRSYTVAELAKAMSLADNTIRAHLATLERDGYVRQTGTRPGTRRPHHDYSLTPEAEQMFAVACDPVLASLLDALAARLPDETLDTVLRETGERLAQACRAARAPGGSESAASAAAIAASALDALGAVAEVDEEERGSTVRARRCPLAELVRERPALCRIVESCLSNLTGRPVRAVCETGLEPRCAFALDAGPSGPAG